MLVAIRIDERHEEPVDVVDILWVSGVVLYQLSNDVSHSTFRNLIFKTNFVVLKPFRFTYVAGAIHSRA